jgi:GAF domain-containing protein
MTVNERIRHLERLLAVSRTLSAAPDLEPCLRYVSKESRHYKGVDQAAGFRTRSNLAVPVIYRGQTVGVLEAVNKTGQAHYTGEDLTILETLASQASIVMENARLNTFLLLLDLGQAAAGGWVFTS